jgi:hypothetical protein
LAESKAIPRGELPTTMRLPSTVLVCPDITDIEPPAPLVTYTSPLKESKAIDHGSTNPDMGLPTGIVAITESALATPTPE